MFTSLQTRLKRASRWLPVMLLPFAAQAQLNYAASNVVNVAGTYADLGTAGTAITVANPDNANSAAQPIGFTFNYNGVAFTQFVLNTNGVLKLGSTPPSTAALYYENFAGGSGVDPLGGAATAADVNLVMPFNFDLEQGTGGTAEFRVQTTGTAPNQVCTVQWKNVKDKSEPGAGAPAQFNNFSFQAKLYQNGNIEFVYGPVVASTNAAATRFPNVGLKGSGTATNQVSLALKGVPSSAWSTTTFINQNYGLQAHNVSNAGLPDLGRTYRFVPTILANNDVAVTALFALGKVSSTYGSPATAQAVVTNTGTTVQNNLVVSLTVNGGTPLTQTVATLAAGASATVTFTYPFTGTSGTNALVVTVPADDVATNNSRTATQNITAADVSHFPAGAVTYTNGIGSNTTANTLLLARYQVTSPAAITTVTPTFFGTTTTTYQVVIYSATGPGNTPGTMLYTSPTRTRPSTAIADPVAVPSINVTGEFFVGVKQLTTTNIGVAYLTDAPLRPATFYISGNGTTFTDLGTSALAPRLALDATLGAPSSCGVATGLASTGVTTNGATVTFTAGTGATGYTVTYTAAGGMPVTVTPAPTGSPVVLTGLMPGTTYTVSVTTNCAAGATSGIVTTSFTTLPVAPANDNCTAATVLPVGATCTNTLGTTVGATASVAPVPAPSCGGPALGPLLDVWYSLVVPANGAVTVSTSAATGSTLTDTVLELYSGTCGTLISVGCNDDFGGTNYSTVSLTGQTAGATLYARVRSYGTTPTGTFNICARAVTCLPVTALTAGSITTTGATITFTAPAGATGYTVTYTAAGGMPVTVTPAPTASPVVLTGLTAGTTYTVTVTTNCAAGQTSSTATTTFTTQSTPAPYATLPVNESFEGPWVNGSSTRDLPTANWRNSPATGNASWRRDDDGTSAGWLLPTASGYSPVSSQGARSARFHSAWAVAGLIGSLDLYVNLSGAAGNRTLTFDYINPTSSTTSPADKLDVLVSTDGGATFSTTPLLTATNSATFTGRTVIIPSTSATSVIRFRALADFGNDDLGIDNVRVSIITATRNEALAATVSLYPNPAHRAFTLDVPAGALRTATATLHNALGQSVQTRQLSAAGSTTFDVSGLAAGVYSLELKAGGTLVVKRVVVE